MSFDLIARTLLSKRLVALAPLVVALEFTLVVSIREISKLKMPSAMRLLQINNIRGGRLSFGRRVNSSFQRGGAHLVCAVLEHLDRVVPNLGAVNDARCIYAT